MSSWTGERRTGGLERGDLETRVRELEKLVAELVKVIKITAGGVSIEAQSMMWIKCPMSLSIESAGSMDIRASGTLAIRSALVALNGGTKPVARTGDLTMPSPGPGAPSVIGPGCPTVLA